MTEIIANINDLKHTMVLVLCILGGTAIYSHRMDAFAAPADSPSTSITIWGAY